MVIVSLLRCVEQRKADNLPRECHFYSHGGIADGAFDHIEPRKQYLHRADILCERSQFVRELHDDFIREREAGSAQYLLREGDTLRMRKGRGFRMNEPSDCSEKQYGKIGCTKQRDIHRKPPTRSVKASDVILSDGGCFVKGINLRYGMPKGRAGPMWDRPV